MQKHRIIITYFATLFLASCTTVQSYLPIYKIDIQQGNRLTEEKINQLQPAMNERQVRFLMGTPLLMDPFHPQRWDYVYTHRSDGKRQTEKRLSLFFEADELTAVQGDFRPTGQSVAESVETTTVLVPKRQQERGLFKKIKDLFSW